MGLVIISLINYYKLISEIFKQMVRLNGATSNLLFQILEEWNHILNNLSFRPAQQFY